ncbi:hypothetical protein GCM10023201_21030 [Actinomycetospora corticicola]|uniref:Uncharacterized protein n=1 Tax=Actinomycetospora corticicola TaxID=663602 RepID=A0A7Y9DRJ0_9PSEU|nr:hypothetical protein [Actinomycetospora corticicola]NYD34181.1 hypothetical protein [Actinomycetospora corticicola]
MTTSPSGPRRRLAAVDTLMASPADPRVAARASVWLLRLAVEHALDDLWREHAPELVESSRRAQFLVLPKFLDAEDAWRVAELWNVLSRVAHHHAYELTPTRAEIANWRDAVGVAVAVLEWGVGEPLVIVGGS